MFSRLHPRLATRPMSRWLVAWVLWASLLPHWVTALGPSPEAPGWLARCTASVSDAAVNPWQPPVGDTPSHCWLCVLQHVAWAPAPGQPHGPVRQALAPRVLRPLTVGVGELALAWHLAQPRAPPFLPS
jgi:hypothetical protein